MTRYRKVPVEIEARRAPQTLGTEEAKQFYAWAIQIAEDSGRKIVESRSGWSVETLEGVMLCRPGDYLIRGIAGELYPCAPEIFHKSYELADRDHVDEILACYAKAPQQTLKVALRELLQQVEIRCGGEVRGHSKLTQACDRASALVAL